MIATLQYNYDNKAHSSAPVLNLHCRMRFTLQNSQWRGALPLVYSETSTKVPKMPKLAFSECLRLHWPRGASVPFYLRSSIAWGLM